MKAKKPILLGVLILALLAVELVLPATASGVPADESKVVTFDGCMYTSFLPGAGWPTDAAPPSDAVFYGYRFAPYGTQTEPGDIEDREELYPLYGVGPEFVYVNQGNLHTHGTVTVKDYPEEGSDDCVWEWVAVGKMGEFGPLPYQAWGRGVSGAVKAWVLYFEVTPMVPPLAETTLQSRVGGGEARIVTYGDLADAIGLHYRDGKFYTLLDEIAEEREAALHHL